jgi:hypothetical protein
VMEKEGCTRYQRSRSPHQKWRLRAQHLQRREAYDFTLLTEQASHNGGWPQPLSATIVHLVPGGCFLVSVATPVRKALTSDTAALAKTAIDSSRQGASSSSHSHHPRPRLTTV